TTTTSRCSRSPCNSASRPAAPPACYGGAGRLSSGGSGPRELLQTVVEARLGRVDRALPVHPDAVDTAPHELARLAACLAPAAEPGTLLRPDLDAGPATDVQYPVRVDQHLVGVRDREHPDVRAIQREELQPMVLAVAHDHLGVAVHDHVMRHVKLAW